LKEEKNTIQVIFPTIYNGIYSGVLDKAKLSHRKRGMAQDSDIVVNPDIEKQFQN